LPPQLAIDHVVIAVRDLDAAAASFRELGFTLTPRGFHSIGSQNHCIMFGSTYVELLAAPLEHPWLDYYRRFLREHGDGLAAIALSTRDADAAYAELRARGVAAKPPMDLSRPVEGGVARFRLVQLDGAPGVFVCQHLTRELVWRREWQAHANGAADLAGVSLEAGEPCDGLPASIEWRRSAALRISGLRGAREAHGVRLVPA
jgi:4-hydroxyphenylpyruvate dioxygenase-like putative hemolysin